MSEQNTINTEKINTNKINIVLLEPEIPQNTGNIGRTCKAMGAVLHLIEPLGFSVEDKYLRRAGMDYWKDLDVKYYKSFEHFMSSYPEGQKVFISQKAGVRCDRFSYPAGVFLIFGKESTGLPEDMIVENRNNSVRVPMSEGTRSLNLANAVSILCYEVNRQNDFQGMKTAGTLAG